MRPRSKSPMTPAERQAKCRAIKKGTYYNCVQVPCDTPPGMTPIQYQRLLAAGQNRSLPAPPPGKTRALPSPPSTAIQETKSINTTSLAVSGIGGATQTDDGSRLNLPPAVAARLRALLDRHEAGKSLTAAERAEAQGLIDIAEYFAVQRLRYRLAG